MRTKLILVTLVIFHFSATGKDWKSPYDHNRSPMSDEIKPPVVDPQKDTSGGEIPKFLKWNRPSALDNGRVHFSLGAGYQVRVNDAKFKDAYFNDGLGDEGRGHATMELAQAFSFQIEVRMMPKNSLGFLSGVNFEEQREIKGGDVDVNGQVYLLLTGADASKFRFTTIYSSAVYRWSRLYFPVGLNYTFVKESVQPNFAGTSTVKGGMGGQAGVGGLIDKHFAMELDAWVTTMEWRAQLNGGINDFGRAYFSSYVLMIKYIL